MDGSDRTAVLVGAAVGLLAWLLRWVCLRYPNPTSDYYLGGTYVLFLIAAALVTAPLWS